MPRRSPLAEKPLAEWCRVLRSSGDAEERYRALQAIVLLAVGDQSLEWLRLGLDDADSSIRAAAARGLAALAEATPRPGVADVWHALAGRCVELLGDDDPDVRFEAARGLTHLQTSAALAADVLLRLLSDDETQPAMLAAILKTLQRTPRSSSSQPPDWPRWLRHEQAVVREEAARTLARWGIDSPALAGELLPLLDDDEPFVREEAVQALGTLTTAEPDVVAALELAATDDDAVVAAAALAVLVRWRGEAS